MHTFCESPVGLLSTIIISKQFLNTQLKVKNANLKYTRDEMLRKLTECENLISNSEKEISKLDTDFPDYKNQYMDKYNNTNDMPIILTYTIFTSK